MGKKTQAQCGCDILDKAQKRWQAEAHRTKKELTAAIRKVNAGKDSQKKTGFRCVEWLSDYYCSGEMVVRSHDRSCPIWKGLECDCSIKFRTWVGAHSLPVFVQCSGCGYAPANTVQLILMGRMLAKK